MTTPTTRELLEWAAARIRRSAERLDVLSWSPGKFRLSDKDMDVLRESINQAKAASV